MNDIANKLVPIQQHLLEMNRSNPNDPDIHSALDQIAYLLDWESAQKPYDPRLHDLSLGTLAARSLSDILPLEMAGVLCKVVADVREWLKQAERI